VSALREQYADVGRGVTLCFEDRGDHADPVVVLVAGLGQQLVSWPEPLCDALVGEGYRVVRFDNRDSGRSTHTGTPRLSPAAMLRGRFPAASYELHDMAADLRGLLDALGVDRAHLVGASMGGMIAQTAAARYPERVASLTSVFSTTGAKGLGRPHWTTWLKLLAAAPASAQEAADAEARMFRHIGSHGFRFREDQVREAALRAWERDSTAGGVERQLTAILKSGDRTAELASITAPTLVIHGDRDRMVATSGGVATQRAVPDARLWIVPGMGHDYPEELWPELVRRIASHISAADHEPVTERSGSTLPVAPAGPVPTAGTVPTTASEPAGAEPAAPPTPDRHAAAGVTPQEAR
jgi:pimeloyl-ACP methyl ester carboxylesterase